MESLEGFYFDPLHGGCLRHIVVDSRREENTDQCYYTVWGVYGSDEVSKGKFWTAKIVLEKRVRFLGYQKMYVDFAGKEEITHGRQYRAKWWPRERRIKWQDGNTWKKMFVHQRQF